MILLAACGMWLFIIAVSPVPQWLVYRLERQYPAFDPATIQKLPVNILVLGAGHTVSRGQSAVEQLSPVTLSRLIEAVRIHTVLGSSKIIGSGDKAGQEISQGRTVALAAIELGVESNDTLMIETPAETSEEANDYASRFGTIRQLVLVTSAIHMPRAMAYFRIAGVKAIAAPADRLIRGNGVYDFEPSVLKIQMMEKAVHEYGGLFEMQFF